MRRALALLLSVLTAAGPAAAQVVPRVLLAQPSAASVVAPFSAAPSAASALPAASVPAAPAPGIGALAPAAAATPLPSAKPASAVLRVAEAGAAFDGSRARSAAAEGRDPVFGDPVRAGAVRLQPRKLPLHPSLPPIYKAFRDTMVYTSFAAAAAPVLWGAAPLSKETYLLPAVAGAGLLVLGGINLARWIARRLFEAPSGRPAPPNRKERLSAVALGLIYGLILGAGVQRYTGPIVQAARSTLNLVTKQKTDVQAVQGTALAEETARVLSLNSVGRSILEKYRDRAGVVRLPTFFLEDADASLAARYDGATDGIYVNRKYLEAAAPRAAANFESDPEAQRRFVREIQETLAHELMHGVQARRPPFSRETMPFVSAMEREYEAFGTEHLYVHEALKADPHAEIEDTALSDYRARLGRDLSAALHEIDSEYEHSGTFRQGHAEGAYWKAFYSDMNARWPGLRVEGYLLLARRSLPRDPIMARQYLEKAQDAAAKAGLPIPTLEIPSRP